ncbi:MAG: glycosyltransferase [candidate division Zixibacteria bacterium]|nr:glycosyltransferase [candidate division Zixibacteria bacterium]
MTILIATESYHPTIDGGAVMQHNLALALAARGHAVHVIAPSDRYADSMETDGGTTVHRVASVRTPLLSGMHRFAWRPAKTVTRIVKTVRPDVAHIHNPFPIGYSAFRACRKTGVPMVATNHWLPENMTNFVSGLRFLNAAPFVFKANWWWINRFHNQCRFTTAPTQTAIDLMVRNGLKPPFCPVSNGVDSAKFHPGVDSAPLRQRLGLPDKPIALYTGRLSGEKFVDVFVRAIPTVLKNIDAHFIIGGEGREAPYLKQQVQTLCVADHVTFPGFVSADDLPRLYRCADVFVIPSICELQSVVTLEALACGLPVVATNRYALPELVRHGVSGLLFEPGDTETLATHLTTLLGDPKLRRKMGVEGVKIAGAHAFEQVVTTFEEIYGEVGRNYAL